MAVMIPDRLDESVESAAERYVFEHLRQDLGPEWIGLHSLGVAQLPSLPWAEIDFVLIGPPGVFCLEVKGGRVAFKDGHWYFINRRGEWNSKRRGPFEQVGPASTVLYKHLHDRMPTLPLLVGYGVVTPDIRFDIVGPGIIPEVVYDEDDRERSFAAYVERLSRYWSDRQGRNQSMLTPVDITAIRDCLRGDFDLRPSLRSRVRRATDELLKLTQEQYAVLDGLVDNPRVLVRGGAGTGKTLLAVEEARRRATCGAAVALFCYNRRLAGFLREVLSDVPACDVYHLHGFMASIVSGAGHSGRVPRGASDAFTKIYPELTLEVLLSSARFQSYDTLIVDEAQDLLRENYLDVFDALLKGGLATGEWRFFFDPFQNLYDGIEETALDRLERGGPARYTLRTNCRNASPVAVATALMSGVYDAAALRVDGPEVEEQWYRDERHQVRLVARCINRLLGEGLQPCDIVILSPRRLERSALRLGLEDVPVKISDIGNAPDVLPPRTIGFATLHSFKGLESDAVLLVDIDDLGVTSDIRDARQEPAPMLYVGASRARAYLAVFIHEAQRDAYAVRAFRYGRSLV